MLDVGNHVLRLNALDHWLHIDVAQEGILAGQVPGH